MSWPFVYQRLCRLCLQFTVQSKSKSKSMSFHVSVCGGYVIVYSTGLRRAQHDPSTCVTMHESWHECSVV